MTIGLQAYLQGYMHDKTAEDSFLDSPEYKEWADNRQAKYPGAGEIDFDFDDPEHPLYTGVEDKDMDVANDFSDVFKYKSGPKWAETPSGRSDARIREDYLNEQNERRKKKWDERVTPDMTYPQIREARREHEVRYGLTPSTTEGGASDRYHRGGFPEGFQQYIEEAGSIPPEKGPSLLDRLDNKYIGWQNRNK